MVKMERKTAQGQTATTQRLQQRPHVPIVIGAGSGIGRELSKILSKNQYTVGVMARRVHMLDELLNKMGSDVLVERIDVSDADSAKDG
jgi:NADP-dependent 3-hydroxy acid dehydrogenase YdfG